MTDGEDSNYIFFFFFAHQHSDISVQSVVTAVLGWQQPD